MDSLQIIFADGYVLSCRGAVVDTSGGELRGNEDGTYTEIRNSVKFQLTEGTLGHASEPKNTLEPGLYLIDEDGLWLHV